jgi:hypothetical protein
MHGLKNPVPWEENYKMSHVDGVDNGVVQSYNTLFERSWILPIVHEKRS